MERGGGTDAHFVLQGTSDVKNAIKWIKDFNQKTRLGEDLVLFHSGLW